MGSPLDLSGGSHGILGAWKLIPGENFLNNLNFGPHVFSRTSSKTYTSCMEKCREEIKEMITDLNKVMDKLVGQPGGGDHPALNSVWKMVERKLITGFDVYKQVEDDVSTIENHQIIIDVMPENGLLYRCCQYDALNCPASTEVREELQAPIEARSESGAPLEVPRVQDVLPTGTGEYNGQTEVGEFQDVQMDEGVRGRRAAEVQVRGAHDARMEISRKQEAQVEITELESDIEVVDLAPNDKTEPEIIEPDSDVEIVKQGLAIQITEHQADEILGELLIIQDTAEGVEEAEEVVSNREAKVVRKIRHVRMSDNQRNRHCNVNLCRLDDILDPDIMAVLWARYPHLNIQKEADIQSVHSLENETQTRNRQAIKDRVRKRRREEQQSGTSYSPPNAKKLKIESIGVQTRQQHRILQQEKELKRKHQQDKKQKNKLQHEKELQSKLQQKKEQKKKLQQEKEVQRTLQQEKELQRKFQQEKELQSKLQQKKEQKKKLQQEKEVQRTLQQEKELQRKFQQEKELRRKLQHEKELKRKLQYNKNQIRKIRQETEKKNKLPHETEQKREYFDGIRLRHSLVAKGRVLRGQ